MLLNCSTIYSKDDTNSTFLYGGSQRIELNISEIKSINTKLIELECYKKEVELYKHLTNNLKVINDSLTLDLTVALDKNIQYEKEIQNQKNLKKVFMFSTGGFALLLLIVI